MRAQTLTSSEPHAEPSPIHLVGACSSMPPPPPFSPAPTRTAQPRSGKASAPSSLVEERESRRVIHRALVMAPACRSAAVSTWNRSGELGTRWSQINPRGGECVRACARVDGYRRLAGWSAGDCLRCVCAVPGHVRRGADAEGTCRTGVPSIVSSRSIRSKRSGRGLSFWTSSSEKQRTPILISAMCTREKDLRRSSIWKNQQPSSCTSPKYRGTNCAIGSLGPAPPPAHPAGAASCTPLQIPAPPPPHPPSRLRSRFSFW
eukprot:scaffold18130_cov119-Isochrysis_galbana.AAC.5